MSVDLDHLIVFCSAGAPEAEDLVRLGLTEGSPCIHTGQSTANRRFVFQNAFIELLWVSDPNEVQSEPVRGRPGHGPRAAQRERRAARKP